MDITSVAWFSYNFTRVMKHIKWGFVLKQLKAEFMLKWDAAQPEIYLSLWPS